MNISINVLLQSAATVLIAAGTTMVGTNSNSLVGAALILVGVICYVVYEKLPA